MNIFSKILAAIFLRKKRDDQWDARFTNTTPAEKLPLDPGKSELS